MNKSRRSFLKQAALVSAVGIVTGAIITQAGPVITVGIDVGRKKYDCQKFGICRITIGVELSGRAVPATAQLDGQQILLQFQRPLRTNETTMPVDEPIKLSPALCKALGARTATVLPGEYKIVREGLKTSVRVNVKAE